MCCGDGHVEIHDGCPYFSLWHNSSTANSIRDGLTADPFHQPIISPALNPTPGSRIPTFILARQWSIRGGHHGSYARAYSVRCPGKVSVLWCEGVLESFKRNKLRVSLFYTGRAVLMSIMTRVSMELKKMDDR